MVGPVKRLPSCPEVSTQYSLLHDSLFFLKYLNVLFFLTCVWRTHTHVLFRTIDTPVLDFW